MPLAGLNAESSVSGGGSNINGNGDGGFWCVGGDDEGVAEGGNGC